MLNKRRSSDIFFYCLIIIFFSLNLYLNYNQTLRPNNLFPSDTPSHISFSFKKTTGENIGYSLLHSVVSVFSNLVFFIPDTNENYKASNGKFYNLSLVKRHAIAMILILSLFSTLTVIVIREYFKKKISRFKSIFIIISFFFISLCFYDN